MKVSRTLSCGFLVLALGAMSFADAKSDAQKMLSGTTWKGAVEDGRTLEVYFVYTVGTTFGSYWKLNNGTKKMLSWSVNPDANQELNVTLNFYSNSSINPVKSNVYLTAVVPYSGLDGFKLDSAAHPMAAESLNGSGDFAGVTGFALNFAPM